MKRSLSILLVVILLGSMFLIGCQSSEAPEGGDSQPATEAPSTDSGSSSAPESKLPKGMKEVNGIVMDEEQYLNLVIGEPESLDSSRMSISSAFEGITPLSEGLTRCLAVDGVDTVKPGMAERWEVNETGDVYTFYLRDAVWSDGVPVTAHDFEYAWLRVMDPKTASPYSWFLYPVIKNGTEFHKGEVAAEEVGVKAIDDKTFEVTLSRPIPYFMQYTYFCVCNPLRKDIVDKYGDAFGQEAEHMVSNGPFVIDEWVHDAKLSYSKNDKYWDAENVYLDKLNFSVIIEQETRMNALLNGELDNTTIAQKEWEDLFKNEKGFEQLVVAEPTTSWLVFNQNDKYFGNLKIRKAFATAYDRQKLVDMVFGGARIPCESYVPGPINIGDSNYQKMIGEPKYVSMLQNEVKDPKALFIEGLEELGLDPDPSKHTIKFMTLGNTDISRKEGEFFQQEYKNNLGVNIELEIYQSNISYDNFDNGDYQIFSTGWLGDYDDPSTFMDIWHFETGYYGDKVGFDNQEFDDLIDEAASTLDPNKRAEAYKKACKIFIYDEAVVTPMHHRKYNAFHHEYVQGWHQFLFAKRNYVGMYTKGR